MRLPPHRAARTHPANGQPPPESAPQRRPRGARNSAGAGPTYASCPTRSARSASFSS